MGESTSAIRVRRWRSLNRERNQYNNRQWYEKNRATLLQARAERKRRDPEQYRRDQAANSLMKLYGLSQADWEHLFARQEGRCANNGCRVLISNPFDTPGDLAQSHVDHCHATGRVRGLLCRNYNIALGLLSENGDRIAGLARYQRRHCS